MRKFCFFVTSIGFVVLVALCLPLRSAGPAVAPPSTGPALRSTRAIASPAATPDPTHAVHHSSPKLPRQPAPAPVQAGSLPLEFEANRGQAPARFSFVAHGPNYSLGLAPREITLSLRRSDAASPADIPSALAAQSAASTTRTAQLHLRLLGANQKAAVEGLQPQPGVSNYFIGNDPAKWHTNVPHFGTARIAGAYPGVDLIYYGNPQQLEYDFQVAPGADPDAIRVAAEGARSAALDKNGNLVLSTAAGDVQLKHPDAYQQIDGQRRTVKSEFQLLAGNVVQFRVGDYDHSKPLVIDPVLLYAVALGGSNGNQSLGMAVDAAGNAYVTGNTCSFDFPSTAGNFQTHAHECSQHELRGCLCS